MILKKKQLQQQLNRYYSTTSPCKELSTMIGLEKEEFIKWIDNQLIDGMNSGNYGKIWQLDHVVPVHLFDFDNYQDVKLCFHHLNIIPLLNLDNKFKGASVHFSAEIIESRIAKYGSNQILMELKKRCKSDINSRWSKYL